MDRLWKIAVSVGLVVVVIVLLWFMFSGDVKESASPPPSEEDKILQQEREVQMPVEAREEEMPAAVGDSRKEVQEREVLKPEGLFITGRVTDKSSGDPVKAYHLILLSLETFEDFDQNMRMLVLEEQIKDSEGRFSVPVEKGGEYEIEISSSRYLSASAKGLHVSDTRGLSGIEIALDSGLSVIGRVVEDATDRAVPNAVVMAVDPDVHRFGFGYFSREAQFFIEGDKEACINAETNDKGLFNLRGLTEKERRITAVHPDFAEAFADIVHGETGAVEIRLKEGYCVYGKVFSDQGEPLHGVLIQLSGEDIPVGRLTTSGTDGTYRTAPALPGLVKVGAVAPPPDIFLPEDELKTLFEQIQESKDQPDPGILEELEKYQFEEETKTVRIVDRDVEVNFGVAEEYVTWKGTLYGADGLPVPYGNVHVSRDFSYPWKNLGIEAGFHYVYCDDDGRFEVKKLAPGRYEVEISLPVEEGEESKTIPWEKVTFSKPGIVEKDIKLTQVGSEISGRVVFARTGEPVLGKTGAVEAAVRISMMRRTFTATFDQDGRFRFTGLPAGQYRLSVKRPAERIPSTRDPVGYAEVAKNEKVTDVKVPFIEEGQLKLEVSGVKDPGFKRINVRYCLAEGFQIYSHTGLLLDEAGSLEETITLGEDKYLVIISHPGSRGVGQYDALFEIFDEEETVISIGPQDFTYFVGDVAVSGTLKGADGSPAAKAKLVFSSDHWDTPSLAEGQKLNLDAMTDESGRFFVTGFRPGIWRTSTIVAEGKETVFPNLYIPIDAAGTVSLDLVLPIGTVSGVFRDSHADRLLDETGPEWKVFLYGRNAASGRASGKGGPDFKMEGVPPGRYILIADVTGYQRYYSDPFELKAGQNLDLGEVKLVPCGTLDLEILDRNQMPVEEFELFCNDEEVGSQRRGKKLGPGRFRFDKLPLGSVEIKVKVPGYTIQTKKLELEPAKPRFARVILE